MARVASELLQAGSRVVLNRRQWLTRAAAAGLCSPLCRPLTGWAEPAADRLAGRFRFEDRHRKPRDITGHIVVEAEDGGLLLQGVDGQLWQVPPNRLQERIPTANRFQPLTGEELGRQVVQEMGPGFQSLIYERHVLCSNAPEPYARWCGAMLDRLADAFRSHWKQRGLTTVEPPFPMVAILFQRQTQFAEFAAADAGPDVAAAPGYYSISTNRIVLRDLTESSRGQPARSSEEVEQRLGTALYNVATMIHEATHQVAFNCGLHTRLADNPLWLTEGMATYFETPDMRSKTGWKTAGQINRARLLRFREFLAQRRLPDSLDTLTRDDERFTAADTAEDAYAESWALTYYLIRKQSASYLKYLTQVSQKQPLEPATAAQRQADFRAAFGELPKLDGDLLRYLKSLR